MKLPPCPSCGCCEPYIAEVDDGMLCVACPRCGMSSAISVDGDPDEAVAAWMHLHRKICTGCRKWLIARYTTRVKELKNEIAVLKEASNGKSMV